MSTPSVRTKFKGQVEKILWITGFWILISVFQFLVGYSTLLGFSCDLGGQKPGPYLLASIMVGLAAGLLGGTLMVFYWERWLRNKSYGWSLLNIWWSYTLLYLAIAVLSTFLFLDNRYDVSVFQAGRWNLFWNDFFSYASLQNYVFWLIVVIVTLIAMLVNDKYGPGVFRSFIMGKYFQPKREERIFMFLDLRQSTAIAEQLGESRYFDFLKDAFSHATPAILNSKGEIYQYVGDEIVLSWKEEVGAQNAKCLQCFFEIQKIFREKADYYKEKYSGIVPEFKAGLHYGFVMVGEIGIVKRDIAYSGDVLNTTSRIQDKCNELGVDILFSKYLLDKIKSLPDAYHPRQIGKMLLRGKHEAVMLYTV